MSDKSNQSLDKNIHKINEGFHSIDNLNRSNYGTKGFDGIGNLNPINSGGASSGEIIPNGLDGISRIAPKPQTDQSGSGKEK